MRSRTVAIIEFLIGWLVLPRVIFFGLAFSLAMIGLGEPQIYIYAKIIEAMLILILFSFRRAMALGYLCDYLLGLFGLYALIMGWVPF